MTQQKQRYPLQASTLGGTTQPQHLLRALADEVEQVNGVDTVTADARAYAALAESYGSIPDAVDDSLEAQRWRIARDRMHEFVHAMIDLLERDSLLEHGRRH